MDLITKTFTADSLELKEGSREFIATISTNSIDRDGEIVIPKGMKKKNYQNSQVILSNHDYQKLPIGVARWVKVDGDRVVSKGYISDKTELARDVWGLMQDGVLKSFSIGFKPLDMGPPSTKELEANPNWAEAKNIIRSWELVEYSVVGVPANPDAQAIAIAKGLSPDTVKFLGSEWEPKPVKSYWDWSDVEQLTVKTTTIDKVAAAYGMPVDEPTIPQPKFSRSWKSVSAQLKQLEKEMLTENEIFNFLKGRV